MFKNTHTHSHTGMYEYKTDMSQINYAFSRQGSEKTTWRGKLRRGQRR